MWSIIIFCKAFVSTHKEKNMFHCLHIAALFNCQYYKDAGLTKGSMCPTSAPFCETNNMTFFGHFPVDQDITVSYQKVKNTILVVTLL